MVVFSFYADTHTHTHSHTQTNVAKAIRVEILLTFREIAL